MQNETQIFGQHAQTVNILRSNIPVQAKVSSSWRKPWHSDHDLNLRREIFSQITKFVQKHGLDSKLPAIANELEGALYVDAQTKDEYGNLMTLEHRICSLMLRWRNRQKLIQQPSLAGPHLPEAGNNQIAFSGMPFTSSKTGLQSTVPGRPFSNHGGQRVQLSTGGACVPSAYNFNTMGGFSNNGFTSSVGQVPSSSFGGVDVQNSDVTSNTGMMIPTPGLNINSGISNNGRTSFVKANDGSLEKMRQHMLSAGLINSTYVGIKFQRDSFCANNIDQGNIGITSAIQAPGSSQTFMNNPMYNSTLYHSSMKQNINQVFPPHSNFLNPSLPNQRSYGATGEDISGVTVITPENNFSTKGMDLTSIRTFDQSDAGFSKQNISHIQASPNSPVFSVVSQEHNQHLGKSNEQENYGVNRVSGNSQQLDRSPIDQDVLVDILSIENPKYQINRDQVSFLEHLQSEQLFEDADNIYAKNEMETSEAFVHSEQQKIHKKSQDILSVDQHSEQTYQATSADTGQSEVVSNDDSLPAPVKEIIFTEQIKRSQWLLVLCRHVSHCHTAGECSICVCKAACELWKHVTTCQNSPCSNHRCTYLKLLLNHHKKCRNSKCVICGPVRLSIARKRVVRSPTKHHQNTSVRPTNVESLCTKKAKIETFSPCVVPAMMQCTVNLADGAGQLAQDSFSNMNNECIESSSAVEMNEMGSDLGKLESPIQSSISTTTQSQENMTITSEKEVKEVDCDVHDASLEAVTGTTGTEVKPCIVEPERVMPPEIDMKLSTNDMKPVKKKISGITYIESLSPEQIRQHIASLRKWIGQSKGKAEKNQAMEHQMSASACSACAVENLSFEPIPIFCTQCGCRIKRNAIFHSFGSGDNSLNFCSPCYNSIRSDVVETDGLKIQKSMLEKKKNDEQRVEGWVECDKCKKWQHQICVLFNARINKERSEYICPECCIDEMERGERIPLPPNSVLGAKDLPRTVLSDFVEERLSCKLEHERAERAKVLGKSPEEIPTADGLVVRVISSVDKKLEVKPKFLELFQQEDYPKDFLYKSKMLMLFQKIEGVEVCLFGMYVQEFGADSPHPNHRHVYLSYLDSVKYFRPDVKTVSGEALRTYVYHEILIAYLDYCKKRGFSSCYIWACPPLKGDDYILYCHPEIQKTPKTDKLREWYISMIAKAKKENIVTANKNLYDYFFTSSGECKARISATRLPYFDGDYWPGAAEDILQQLQEEEEGIYTLRKGKTKKLASKRTTKTSAQAEVGGTISKDIQLMQKLGQSIAAMKEDFIMVHLHHACSRCRDFITSGHRWFCHLCGDQFQLCSCCYEEHAKLSDEEKHPFGKKETHSLIMEEVCDIPAETIDRDDFMESEYFDNRQAFLSLCQGNQYQYDTLRRAKHSSMMILYHLHNPNAPAFISSCAICHSELEAGHGWKCKSCSDFDVCNGCFSSKEVQQHPHKFVARSSSTDPNSANADVRKRMLQLRMMLDVLVHASKCREPSCQFAKCRNMKDLFRHGFGCTKRAAGGCSLCKRMWFLLTAHARSCKETTCSVPRCMDLRKHLRRTQLQQESRRRAAVNEMIRQRAAEAAGDR